MWKKENGKISNAYKSAKPRVKVKCDCCGVEFVERDDIFNKRVELINKEYCGKCSRPIMCSLAGLKGNYNDNGDLLPNNGRFTTEKWVNLTSEELQIRNKHNKDISIAFHKKLNENPDKKTEFYNKIYKNSMIGYISKGQREIYEIIKNNGYILDGNVSGMRVDIINFEKKIAIEYNGDFWHCNPRTWSGDDFNKVINMYAKDKWLLDRKRRFVLRKLGFEVNVIWEYDWVNNRNKIYDLLKKITNIDYKFETWTPKETLPLKGRTFEEIYGLEKAKELRLNLSNKRIGKKLNKNKIYKVTTPTQGIFYVLRIRDWRQMVKNYGSKYVTYEKISNDGNFEFWDGSEFEIILPNSVCPHCDLVGSGSNMVRYHFDNCKKKKIKFL
jgi:hypothetical protein